VYKQPGISAGEIHRRAEHVPLRRQSRPLPRTAGSAAGARSTCWTWSRTQWRTRHAAKPQSVFSSGPPLVSPPRSGPPSLCAFKKRPAVEKQFRPGASQPPAPLARYLTEASGRNPHGRELRSRSGFCLAAGVCRACVDRPR
jgi:hypothetical protein